MSEWQWEMDYCKKNGIPPAQKWAWDKAKMAFCQHVQEEKKMTIGEAPQCPHEPHVAAANDIEAN